MTVSQMDRQSFIHSPWQNFSCESAKLSNFG